MNGPASSGGSRHPYLQSGRAHLLAHRGASLDEPPGNTWAAFAAALAAGIDHLETDVQVTADGHVVVFHDDLLDEVTTGEGSIASLGWVEAQEVRYLDRDGAPTGEPLVELDELLGRWPHAKVNIDVKTDAAVEPTAAVLRRHRAADRVCVTAFSWRRARRLRSALGPGWCSAASKPEIAAVWACARLRLPAPRVADAVQVPRRTGRVRVVDGRFVEVCHRAGMAVHVWTVDEPAEMDSLFALGVDGVITNDPVAAVRHFGTPPGAR